MKFRAIAVATERSNAIGTVELECTPHGLVVVYLGVGAFSEGYAPVAFTEGTRVNVPWHSVEEARVDGDELFLAFDAAISPHHRFTLVNFSTGNRIHHLELHRRRLILRTGVLGAAFAGPLIAGGMVMRLTPAASGTAALGTAIVTAALILGLGFVADRAFIRGGVEGDLAREMFAADLASYLPGFMRSATRPTRASEPWNWAALQGLLPRTTTAIVISLTACALAAVLMARWVVLGGAEERGLAVRQRAAEPETESAREAVETRPSTSTSSSRKVVASSPTDAPSASTSASTAAGDLARTSGNCRCRRSDSILWREPIPRLSLLVLSQKLRKGRGEDERRNKQYVELELAVVNNGSEALSEVSLLVEFFERDPPPSNKRYQVSNRPLFFEGPLNPGQAIKWSIEAQGTEFSIENPVKGDIGMEGDDAAPTNLLASLLEARNRPVRLHGAMMLTFMGDPRAKEGILSLREALREDEAPYLNRLLQAMSDVKLCKLSVAEHGTERAVRACVFNAGKEPKKDLAVRLRGLGEADLQANPTAKPPEVLVESTFKVPAELAPDSGSLLELTFNVGSAKPAMFEGFADRIDLLPQ